MLLRALEIHTFYGKSHILQGVTLTIAKKEIVGLLGRNGVGKTTALKSILRLVPTNSGSVFYDDVDITALAPHKISTLGIGYVPQGRLIFPEFTVWENLKIAQKNKDQEALERTLNFFPKLKDRMKQLGGTLSGGEQQMLAIARALVVNPKLILMDEPTEGLMPDLVSLVRSILLHLKEEGISILLVEQNVEMSVDICNRLYVMEKGLIKYETETESIRGREDVLIEQIGFKG